MGHGQTGAKRVLQSPPSASAEMSRDRNKSESEENGAVGDRDGKKREQHEKVVNNFMQIKGEQ